MAYINQTQTQKTLDYALHAKNFTIELYEILNAKGWSPSLAEDIHNKGDTIRLNSSKYLCVWASENISDNKLDYFIFTCFKDGHCILCNTTQRLQDCWKMCVVF